MRETGLPERKDALQALRERQVRDALATGMRTSRLADAELLVCPGGLSNHAWTATDGERRYFVRLSPPDPERLGVDRDSECALLHAVASAGLAPAVVRCDPSRRLLVTECIDGAAWSREQATESHNLVRVAQSLRRLHSLAVPAGIQRVDFTRQALHLETQCGEAGAADRDLVSTAREALGQFGGQEAPAVLCHNDLHHLNLVDGGGRLWLVDWEYGGVGDPVFDVASFLCQHDCGREAGRHLLEAYGDGPAADLPRLAAACWLFDYVQWLWYRACLHADPAASAVFQERAASLARKLRAASPRSLALQ
jgi:aminoglycoside phosphotransferase (APT) family kinase protein